MRDRLWIVSFWHQLLYPELGPAGYEDPTGVLASAARRLFGSDQPDYVVAARIHYGEATEHEQQRKTAAVVLRHLHSSFSFDERRLLGFVHGRFLYFCGRFQNASQPSSASTELARRLRALVAHLRQEHGILFTVGVSPRRHPGLSGFRRAAQYAVVALRIQLQTEKGGMLVCDTPRRGEQRFVAKPLVEKLERITRSGSVEAVPEICNDVSGFLFGSEYIPLLKLRGLLQSFLVSLSMAAQTAGVDPALLYDLNQRYFDSILVLYDYEELEQVIHSAIREFVSMVYETRAQELEHPAIARAEAYVMQNISEPLTLSSVAQAVGLSPPYLSRLFRTYRGMTLTQFINCQRVELAKSLLQNSDKNVCAIAFAAGFGSVQHFNRIFKSLVGCTPSQFRLLKCVHL
ncbi:MAG: helix-turn-helix transcriptional regulator [Firmicutes bacterium]|nr:helix-turn-helix transcriptional regulator [Bacillota bacterium]